MPDYDYLEAKSGFMAFNDLLADRVRTLLSARENNIEEKKMFGGLCFMVNGKMCIGVESKRLMVRFDPALTEDVMRSDGCTPMDFTKKVMKGFAFVSLDAVNTRKRLEYWIDIALDYNKIAPVSKKRKKTEPVRQTGSDQVIKTGKNNSRK